jgi:hypothetical protein
VAPSNNRKVNRSVHYSVGRDSVIGIATHYELDGTGFKSRKERKTSSSLHPAIQALGPCQPPVKLEMELLPGYKAAGCGLNQPPLFSAEVRMIRAIPLLPIRACMACHGETNALCVFQRKCIPFTTNWQDPTPETRLYKFLVFWKLTSATDKMFIFVFWPQYYNATV